MLPTFFVPVPLLREVAEKKKKSLEKHCAEGSLKGQPNIDKIFTAAKNGNMSRQRVKDSLPKG